MSTIGVAVVANCGGLSAELVFEWFNIREPNVLWVAPDNKRKQFFEHLAMYDAKLNITKVSHMGIKLSR